jgi:hypothetical protein
MVPACCDGSSVLQVYLKQKLNCALFSAAIPETKKQEADREFIIVSSANTL